MTSQKTTTGNRQAAAELLSIGSTTIEAAKAADVTRETISRWRNHDPEFQLLLAEANAATHKLVHDRITGHAQLAVDTLAKVCRDPEAKGSEKVAAAKAILERMTPPPQDGQQPINPKQILGDQYEQILELLSTALANDHT